MKRKGRGGRVSWRSSVKIMVTRSFSSSFILSLFFRFFFYPISLSFSLFSLFVALVSYFDTQSHFPFSLSLLFFFFFTPPCEKIPVKFISPVDKFNFRQDSPALLAVSIMSAKQKWVMNKFEYLRFFYCVKILERIRVLHNPFFFFLFNWDNTYKNATNFAFVERIRAKFSPFPFAFNYVNFILIFIRNDILFWDISLFGFMIKNLMVGMIYL